MGVGESAGDAYMSHAGVPGLGGGGAETPVQPRRPYNNQVIFIGTVPTDDKLRFFSSEELAVAWFDANVVNNAAMWRASLNCVMRQKIIPPVAAKLGPA